MARHALLIGVSRFDDTRLTALNAPIRDVAALAAILLDPDCGRFNTATVSLDEDYLQIRDRLSALFDDRDPDDLLLLYYSGHGILSRGNRLFLATPSSQVERPQARSLSAMELRDQMDQTRAERQVIVLDCCHSGAFVEGTKGGEAPAVTRDTFQAGDIGAAGRYVLTASDTLQFAWDGDALKEGESGRRALSRFTSWLLDGLARGEAAPDDQEITLDALYRYVSRRAREEDSLGTPQRHIYRGVGDLVIGRNPVAGKPWADIAARLTHPDWSVRFEAVGAAGRWLKRDSNAGKLAHDTLEEVLVDERDYKVRERIHKVLLLASSSTQSSSRPEPEMSTDAPQANLGPVAYEKNVKQSAGATHQVKLSLKGSLKLHEEFAMKVQAELRDLALLYAEITDRQFESTIKFDWIEISPQPANGVLNAIFGPRVRRHCFGYQNTDCNYTTRTSYPATNNHGYVVSSGGSTTAAIPKPDAMTIGCMVSGIYVASLYSMKFREFGSSNLMREAFLRELKTKGIS